MVGLARFHNNGRELRLIRRIREVLGFQTKGCAARVGLAVLAFHFAVEEVARVELDAGLVSPNFEGAAGSGLVNFSGLGKSSGFGVKHPVMVVAFAEFELLIEGFDAFANFVSREEVEGSSLDGNQFACRDQPGIDGSVAAGEKGQFMIEDVAIPLTLEVEVSMVGKVDDGIFISSGGIIDS